MIKAQHLVPVQKIGGSSFTRYVKYSENLDLARKIFQKASSNLLNVNKWHEMAGTGSARFQLVNDMGEEVTTVQKGYFIRISIPQIGSADGTGYDWVRIEKIEGESNSDNEWIAIRVRPAPVPFLLNQTPSHFFSEDATSSFIVERRGRKVIGAIYGRNEKPNLHSEGVFSKLRNLFVAVAAILGLNKPQWKNLAKGWISN